MLYMYKWVRTMFTNHVILLFRSLWSPANLISSCPLPCGCVPVGPRKVKHWPVLTCRVLGEPPQREKQNHQCSTKLRSFSHILVIINHKAPGFNGSQGSKGLRFQGWLKLTGFHMFHASSDPTFQHSMSRVTGFHFLCGFQGGHKTSKDGAPVPEIETQSALLWGTTPWFLFKITLFVDPFLKVKLLSLLSNYCSTADKPKPQKRRIKAVLLRDALAPKWPARISMDFRSKKVRISKNWACSGTWVCLKIVCP